MPSTDIQGFKVLILQFSVTSTSYHQIFIKEHSVRTKDELKIPGQTLFVANVPPIVTEMGLKSAFSSVGNIKAIIFEPAEEDSGFKRAYIVFYKREHLQKALKIKKLNPLFAENKPIQTGLSLWIEQYNSSICNPASLMSEVNNFMKGYEQEKQNVKNQLVDDEGWTVVTKGGRRPGLSRKESLVNKLKEKVQKKSNKKELKDFYTYQIRESKMKNIAQLRKNYEEAKQKVQLMKQARKFKPY